MNISKIIFYQEGIKNILDNQVVNELSMELLIK